MASRRELVLGLVRDEGFASVRHLATVANVSNATARRDIRLLAADGLVEVIHGGARKLSGDSEPPARSISPFRAFLAPRVRPGMTIGICGAQPATELVSAIESLSAPRLVTNSLTAWLQLTSSDPSRNGPRDLVFVPGELSDRGAVTGMLAIESVERFRFDLVLVCGVAFDQTIGLTAPSLSEAAIDRAFIRRATEVVAVTSTPSQAEHYGVVVCGPESVDAVLPQGS